MAVSTTQELQFKDVIFFGAIRQSCSQYSVIQVPVQVPVLESQVPVPVPMSQVQVQVPVLQFQVPVPVPMSQVKVQVPVLQFQVPVPVPVGLQVLENGT